MRMSEAVDYLGVSATPLRNRERTGRGVAHRHPVNRYRLFKREELAQLLGQAERPVRRRTKPGPGQDPGSLAQPGETPAPRQCIKRKGR